VPRPAREGGPLHAGPLAVPVEMPQGIV